MHTSPVSDPATTAAPAAAKQHYLILDGLRGVAALMVVLFHVAEAYRPGQPLTQLVNHGYLAVDFFFLLSGFVIAYAYDDRWGTMGLGDFCRRRLVRLQPMVVLGMVVGALLFPFQAGSNFPLVADTPVWQVLVVMLVGATLLPLRPSMDIRGWAEMHPLNGPAWSLFLEYIGNLLYALFLRRLSLAVLGVLALLALGLTVRLAVFGQAGHLIGGWSLDLEQLDIGFTRLLFPFIAGIVLMRSGVRLRVRGGFGWCALLLVAALAMPRLGGDGQRWINGLYEVFCVAVVFPLVVAIGAGSQAGEGAAQRVATFLGELSYPLYITHFPLVYVYMAWLERQPPGTGAAMGVLVVVPAVLLGWISYRFYDAPVRRWLADRLLRKKGRPPAGDAVPGA